MAVTVTPTLAGINVNVSTVIADADGDVAAVVPHGLGVIPGIVLLTNRLTVVSAISAWATAVIDGTNVNLVCTNTAGSGDPAVQLAVTAFRPHSLIA